MNPSNLNEFVRILFNLPDAYPQFGLVVSV